MEELLTPVKAVSELWQDYLFITREMAKFLAKQDFDMFSELVSQRERLQHLINEQRDRAFLASAEGKELVRRIQHENQAIMRKLQFQLNKSKQQQKVRHAYEGLGSTVVGQRMDWKK